MYTCAPFVSCVVFYLMLTSHPCAFPGCTISALPGSVTCIHHDPKPEITIDRISAILLAQDNHSDLDLCGVTLNGLDLGRKRFTSCSFMGSKLRHCLFTGSIFRLCFFDGAILDSCDFSGLDAEFCSFGDCEIHDTSFENSELIHTNFDGSRIRMCTFTRSNLYDSRFILPEIQDSDFSDCDFKRAYFIPAKADSVILKGSNTAEAIRDMEHLYL